MKIGILALTYRHHGGVFQYHQTLVQSLALLVERGFEITVVASDEFACEHGGTLSNYSDNSPFASIH